MLSIQKLGCILIAVLMCTGVFAQNISVSGNITDASTGDPVPFASIHLEGTTIGVNALTPIVVPSRWIDANGTGSPVDASVMFPETEMFCAKTPVHISTAIRMQPSF